MKAGDSQTLDISITYIYSVLQNQSDTDGMCYTALYSVSIVILKAKLLDYLGFLAFGTPFVTC